MKKKGQHKERVALTISLEGIRIEDETTQVSMQISQILFNHHDVIARDTVTYKLHL